jgi:tRNA-specific 2-thiouridylase
LLEQGYEVVGVTLHLWDYPDDGSVQGRCCAPEDIHDARRVADALGFAHYAFDRRELFLSEVVTPFVDSYLQGETPSPCVRCNRGVKIKELLHLADQLGAARVATGHYARLSQVGTVTQLLRGQDASKDQSYFLHMLDQRTLSRLCFPLGELDKPTVREQAVRLNLPGAHKGESQELCFVPTGRYDRFVADRAAGRARPGPIVDETGRVLGAHEGIFRFTLGQRKNLGVALGERAYVVGLDAESATVTLGAPESLLATSAVLSELSLAPDVSLPVRCGVQVRYRGQPARAEVRGQPGGAVVRFDEPQRAVVRGQFAVLYDGDRVLGGGVIQSAEPARAAPAQPRAEAHDTPL